MVLTKKRNIFTLMLAVIVVFCASGCANSPGIEGPGVEGGNFAKHSSLSEAFSANGNTTVTLSGDETVDLTGVRIVGRKEIFLNNFSLKLTGQYTVSEEGVFDIKPGEGYTEGTINLSELRFDTSQVPTDVPNELPIVEIAPGVEIIEPQTGDGIEVQDFPGVLTVIAFMPARQSASGPGSSQPSTSSFDVNIDMNIAIPQLTVMGNWPCGEQALQDAWHKYYPYFAHFLGEPSDFIQNGLTWKWDDSVVADTVGYSAADNSIQMGPLEHHRDSLERGDYTVLYYQMMHESAHLFVQYQDMNVNYSFGQWIWEASALIAEQLTRRALGEEDREVVNLYDLYATLGWNGVNGVFSDGLKYDRTIVDRSATAALSILVDTLSYDSGYDLIARLNGLIKEKMAEQGNETITKEIYAQLLDTAANGRLIDGMKPSEWLFSQPVSNTSGEEGNYLIVVPFRSVYDTTEPINALVSAFHRYKDARGDLVEESLTNQPFELSIYDSENELVASTVTVIDQHNAFVEFTGLSLIPGAYRLTATATIEGNEFTANNYFIAADPDTKTLLVSGDRLIFITISESGDLMADTATVSLSGSNDILQEMGYVAVLADIGSDIQINGKTYTKPFYSRIILVQ